jgi:hypothetical protein
VISQFRSDVAALLRSTNLLPVHEYVPKSIAEYPCLVVGRANGEPSPGEPVVFDLSLPVFVCGRQQSDEAQDELDKHADQVWTLLGGTRTTRAGSTPVAVDSIASRVITVGTEQVPAYVLTVAASVTTC